MATYTMTLWDYLKAGNPLFDFPYYMWDESQRQRIQQLVADYYMYREICTDNPEYWHHLFKTRWLLHWKYYNDLYQSAYLEFNPLTTHYMKEQEEETRGRKYDENTASLGVTHGDSRMAEAGKTHTDTTTTTDTLNIGTEDETTDRTIDYWETVDKSEKGTLDSTVDITNDQDQHATGKLDKTVTGHSERDKTGEISTTGTSTNTHSDYPQANIAAITPENPGQWATWNENGRTTSHTDATEHETIDTSENTGQSTQEDTTIHEVGKSVTDTDTTNTTKQTTHANTKDTTTRDLDTSSKTDQTEHTVSDTKTYNNAVGHTDGTSQHAVSRETSTNEKRGRGLTVSGYSNFSPSELLRQYRETILNIDQQLINTFQPLFMEVF